MMSLSLTTAPSREPVNLQQVKDNLRLDTDDDDGLLLGYITAAREWVEGQTKRAIMNQTYTLSIDDCWPYVDGMPHIRLPINPVRSVSSITYVTGASPNPTLATDQYMVVARKYGSYIAPAYGVTWPSVRNVPNAITVVFEAGDSSNVPEPLKLAIMYLATHYYEQRVPIVAGQGNTVLNVPYSVESLISPYRS